MRHCGKCLCLKEYLLPFLHQNVHEVERVEVLELEPAVLEVTADVFCLVWVLAGPGLNVVRSKHRSVVPCAHSKLRSSATCVRCGHRAQRCPLTLKASI